MIPALLLWVHAALVDSGLAAGALFGTPLTDADADAYVAEMAVAAELLGVPREIIPDSVAALGRYIEGVRPDLRRTPAAAESMGYLLDPPGLDEDIAELWQDIRDAAVAALPGWAIRAVRLRRRRPADRAAADRDPPGPRRARRGLPG